MTFSLVQLLIYRGCCCIKIRYFSDQIILVPAPAIPTVLTVLGRIKRRTQKQCHLRRSQYQGKSGVFLRCMSTSIGLCGVGTERPSLPRHRRSLPTKCPATIPMLDVGEVAKLNSRIIPSFHHSPPGTNRLFSRPPLFNNLPPSILPSVSRSTHPRAFGRRSCHAELRKKWTENGPSSNPTARHENSCGWRPF